MNQQSCLAQYKGAPSLQVSLLFLVKAHRAEIYKLYYYIPFSLVLGVPFFSHYIYRLHGLYLNIKPRRQVTASDRIIVNVTEKQGIINSVVIH